MKRVANVLQDHAVAFEKYQGLHGMSRDTAYRITKLEGMPHNQWIPDTLALR